MLVIADRLHLVGLPVTLGIPAEYPAKSETSSGTGATGLTAQGCSTSTGNQRDGRRWSSERNGQARSDLGGGGGDDHGALRRGAGGDRHVIAARDGDMLVLQLVAPQVRRRAW